MYIIAQKVLMKNLEMMASGVLDIMVVDIPDRLGWGTLLTNEKYWRKSRVLL